MSKPIWIRLRSVLDRDADATSVELSRESAEEMLAEITRLTADNEKLAEALETAGRLFAAARDALAEVNAENEKLRAALERIADTDPDEGTQWFHEVATAALSGDKHE